MGVTNYSDLVVWQKAMDLVELIYESTRRFPKEELYSLTSQLRRAAISIPSNIAEGQGRRTTRDFLQFLSIAQGSLKEVETQVLIAERLKYLDSETTAATLTLTAQVGRLNNGLMNSLRTDPPRV